MIDIERAVKGETCRDDDTMFILAARAHGLSWDALMGLPYRILLRMNVMSSIENKLNRAGKA